MNQTPYLYVQVMALACYIFLLTALLAAKKEPLIRSFINLLISFIFWTGGSLCMRLRLWPGYQLWYDISILALFITPLLLYNFVHALVGAKGTGTRRILTVVTLVILILTECQLFLKRPEFVDMGNGQGQFVYAVDWPIVIPCIVLSLIVLSCGGLVVRAMRDMTIAPSVITPFLIGMLFLLVGNVASILPGNIFPFDTLAGIFNAMCLLYALYKKRVFKLKLLVSKGTLMMVSILMAIMLLISMTKPVEGLIEAYFPVLAPYTTVAISLGFVVITSVMYKLLSMLIEAIFTKDEVSQSQKLSSFSAAIAKSLSVDEIMDRLIALVTDVVNVEKAYVYLFDEQRKRYEIAASLNLLDVRDFGISADNPCVKWLSDNQMPLMLGEFRRQAAYKAMWEAEKAQFEGLGMQCLVPLSMDQELVGILALTQKPRGASFSYDDMAFLESVKSIVSIAIKNASLYEKAYYESRIDNLTGLLNRKYFYEKINESFEANRERSLALIILNVDDFKLYNQLYGNRQGDIALKKIAGIIGSEVGADGFAARYSGKEFAVVIPGWDTHRALKLAHEILGRVRDMNKGEKENPMGVLTMSGGVCVYPYAASSVKQLIENADMAVYSAKRNGKNKILTYVIDPENPKVQALNTAQKGAKGYQDYASTIYALTAAIDAKDHYTFNHSNNVANYASVLASALGLNNDHVQLISEAALLHDIGKIGVPEHILSKPEKLTYEEYIEMQKHVENSIAMIRHLPSLDYVIPAVLSHHERWDGKGYPRGLVGEDIPVAGRCLALADTFDAMTTDRPYRRALSTEQAINEIEQNANTQFDPAMAKVFVALAREGKISAGGQKEDVHLSVLGSPARY